MSTITTSLIVFVCVFGAALLGMWLRGKLPDHHFSAETQGAVKLAMGFVATMAALILGLLVVAASDSYNKQSSGVTEMAAKVVYLDRILANFGPESTEVRALCRRTVEQVASRMWPTNRSGESQLDPSAAHTEGLFAAIESLTPKNDLQTALKSQALSISLELGQLRWLEYVQANSSVSKPMLCILVFWIAVLFASFGMFSPVNSTAFAALLLAAVSVTGAVFLILELSLPFTGLLQIPKTAFLDAISHLGT